MESASSVLNRKGFVFEGSKREPDRKFCIFRKDYPNLQLFISAKVWTSNGGGDLEVELYESEDKLGIFDEPELSDKWDLLFIMPFNETNLVPQKYQEQLDFFEDLLNILVY